MVGERRSPSVKYRRDADPGAEMPGIGCNGEHGLGRRLEQKAIGGGLVLPCDSADRRRQCEYDVVVGQRQKIGLSVRQPLARGGALMWWTAPASGIESAIG